MCVTGNIDIHYECCVGSVLSFIQSVQFPTKHFTKSVELQHLIHDANKCNLDT